MQLDIEKLMADIKNAMTAIVTKDVTIVRGFSNRQLTGIANQAGLVAAGIASGDITATNRGFFLDQLVELAENFVNTLVGLLMVTIEKLLKAILDIIWRAISGIAGIVLPSPNVI